MTIDEYCDWMVAWMTQMQSTLVELWVSTLISVLLTLLIIWPSATMISLVLTFNGWWLTTLLMSIVSGGLLALSWITFKKAVVAIVIAYKTTQKMREITNQPLPDWV